MITNSPKLTMSIEHPLVNKYAGNYSTPTWPLHPDFPITIDPNGEIVSRYKDDFWDLSFLAGKPLRVSFVSDAGRAGVLSPVNKELLRQIAAWWIFGNCRLNNVGTLANWFSKIRPILVYCSECNIDATKLSNFPLVIDAYAQKVTPSDNTKLRLILERLYEQRQDLGFFILDKGGISILSKAADIAEIKQTPYIPPRLWTYQVLRFREFLDDFLKHQTEFEKCFDYCFRTHYGKDTKTIPNFLDVAKRYGLSEFFERWFEIPKDKYKAVELLSRCLGTIAFAGVAYVINFSLMRIEEAWNIRSNCLSVETDPRFGDMYFLSAQTTKTIQDPDARWPTSPSVAVAIDAMKIGARLRLKCAQKNPKIKLSQSEIDNPYLFQRSFEPWSPTKEIIARVRPRVRNFSSFLVGRTKLLDPKELQITEADLQIAKLINPDLDTEKFGVGKKWHFSWHQFRRTGAVNMMASNLVSNPSVQYLLKHFTRSCSLYYGKNFALLSIDNNAQRHYVRTIYEVLGKEFSRLTDDRFVSPHGDRRKTELLKLVADADNQTLVKLAKSGKIMYRTVLLGGCTKRDGPCSYGGIDSVVHCGGGTSALPCSDVLYDREKLPLVQSLDQLITERLLLVQEDSPEHEALLDQKKAVNNFFKMVVADGK